MWLVYSSIVPCCHRNGFHRFLCMPRQNNRDTSQEKRGPALLFVLLFNLLGNECFWAASFGVPGNSHALVYLFKELLLISRCHVVALLFILLFNILGNECSWAASFGVSRNPHALVYLFKELLLVSRCHAISVLLFLCVQIRVLWLKTCLNLFCPCFCFLLVLGLYRYFSSLDLPAGCVRSRCFDVLYL
jgi:hypothetical protein